MRLGLERSNDPSHSRLLLLLVRTHCPYPEMCMHDYMLRAFNKILHSWVHLSPDGLPPRASICGDFNVLGMLRLCHSQPRLVAAPPPRVDPEGKLSGNACPFWDCRASGGLILS